MTENVHRIEIEIDESRYQQLVAEAERLHIGVDQLIARAASAWLTDQNEFVGSMPHIVQAELASVG